MGDCIVEEWLRPLNLQHYTQAFLDNGYDDLEVCKQIGEPDLDAIGVFDPGHRGNILEAVKLLREQNGSAVYFTLEDPDYASYKQQMLQSAEAGAAGRRQDSLLLGPGKSCVTCPRLQLTILLRERLCDDDIRLNEQPYSDEDGKPNVEALECLASRYAEELNVRKEDVLERLEELQMTILNPDGGQLSDGEMEAESPIHGLFSMISVYGQSPRSAPHPLPPLPSMSCLYIDPMELELNQEESNARNRGPSLTPSTSTDPSNTGSEIGSFTSAETSLKDKVGSTLGRLFRSVTLRRPGKKYAYHQHEGDLNASEMMMSEEERIQLMILVKEGKLSIDEAVEMVKNHRRERHPSECSQCTDFYRQDVKSTCSSPLPSPNQTDSVRSESSPVHRDSKSKILFSSPFSRRKGSGSKESERLTQCFAPLLYRKRSEAYESAEPSKIRSFGWSPPPLPPLPRSSGIIVESMSAECMVRYNGSSFSYSPLLIGKRGDVQPSLPVRKSRSLHSSVPPRMAVNSSHEDSDEGTLRVHSHHYENLRCREGAEHFKVIDGNAVAQNGVCHGRTQTIEGDELKFWATERDDDDDPNKTLTNSGHKILTRSANQERRCVHREEKAKGVEQNGHRSCTRRKHLRDKDEPATSSTDSLTNAVTSGVCGISSSSSHSSMSTEDEPIPKLAYANRVRAKIDYVPTSNDDRDALTLKKGDIIYLLGMHDSRLCRGILNNQIGTFRSSDVEPVHDEAGVRLLTPCRTRPRKGQRHQRRPKPKTVEELLCRLGLQHLTNLFVHHGFSTLDDFSELDEADLNELKLTNPEERIKLLTAAQLLIDSELNEFDSCSRSASQSPALSHDASSQTVLTQFSTRDRAFTVSNGFGMSKNSDSPHASKKTACRYPSETSSDDQEILSITTNGTVMISWGENEMAAFVAPDCAGAKHYGEVFLSDSCLHSASTDAVGGCAVRHGNDRLFTPTRFSKSTTAATQTGSQLPGVSDVCVHSDASFRSTAAGKQCGISSEQNKAPGLETGKLGLAQVCTGNGAGRLCESGNDVLNSVARKTGSELSASFPYLSESSPFVTMRVSGSPSVKKAHVRQLTTSSPLHSSGAQRASLGFQESIANDLALTKADGASAGQLEHYGLVEKEVSLAISDLETSSVYDLLTTLGLSTYITQFTLRGIITTDQLQSLTESQLQALGVKKLLDVQRLMDAIRILRVSCAHGYSSASAHGGSSDGKELDGETQVQLGAVSAADDARKSRTFSKISFEDSSNTTDARTVQSRQAKVTDKV